MAKKITTIYDLAAMVKRGFDQTASKGDLEFLRKDLKKDIRGLDARVKSVETRLKSVDTRLQNVEHLLLKQHSDQLRGLESRVKRLEQLYEIKFQES